MTGQGSIAGVSLGHSVTLAWDANTESDLAGYQIYYSCNKVYGPYNGTQAWQGASPVDIGNRTSYTLTNLYGDCEYWSAAVTAYNTADMESDYSNIVTWEFDNSRTRHIAVGSTSGVGMIASLADGKGATSGAGQILLPFSVIDTGNGAATGYGTEFTIAAGSRIFNGLGITAGTGSVTATGIITTIFGRGATSGIGRLRTLNAVLSPVRIEKHGTGNVLVTGGAINCGSTCEAEIPYNQSLTLTWTRDETESDFYSWGNACQPYERRTSCTLTADSAGQKINVEGDGYMVASLTTGKFGEPICRTGRGTSYVVLRSTLQQAYDAIANGTDNNPIDCITLSGDGPLVASKAVNITLVGGWTDFFPGQMDTGVTKITGGLTVKFGSLTIGSYNGGGAVVVK